MDLTTIDYLEGGSENQQKVYRALRELRVFERLSRFHPVLAGTFPIDLDIPGSDLDILCEVYDTAHFTSELKRYYGRKEGFSVKEKVIKGVPSIIIRFVHADFPVEVFGQPRSVLLQDAYRHMVVEDHLLNNDLKGRRSELRDLRLQGKSTEEAFTALMNIAGDPYDGLLALGDSLGLFP